MRTGSARARWAETAASTAAPADWNAAQTPSPVCLNNQPPQESIADRNTSSWAANSTRISSGAASQRRVEPSISVNKNVTVPDGGSTNRTIRPPTTSVRMSDPRVGGAVTDLSRRSFLGASAAGAAWLALGGCSSSSDNRKRGAPTSGSADHDAAPRSEAGAVRHRRRAHAREPVLRPVARMGSGRQR